MKTFEQTFGEIRSRIHNGGEISWLEIEEFSQRDGYKEEILPYLSSFPEYWASHPLKKVNSVEELLRYVEIAPFSIYSLTFSKGNPFDFSEEKFRYVKSLDVSFNEIGDEGIRHLASSPHMSNLTHLDARGNEIGEEGIRHLAESSYLENLTHLYMSCSRIGDEGIRYLASSSNMKNLTHLDVSWNEIGGEGEKLLRNSPYLKNCKIYT